ncbi:MAG: hypothetical protein MHMPM18_002051 [Marteilia pararefringens]
MPSLRGVISSLKSNYAAILLLVVCYGFLLLSDQNTSHLIAISVPHDCSPKIVSKKEKDWSKALRITAFLAGYLVNIVIALFIDKKNCHRLALGIAGAIMLILLIVSIVFDIVLLDGDKELISQHRKIDEICEKIHQKYKVYLSIHFLIRVIHYVVTLVVYYASNSYVHYALSTQRTVIYWSMILGHTLLLVYQLIAYTIIVNLTHDYWQFAKWITVVLRFQNSIGSLLIFAAIPKMKIIKIENINRNLFHRYRKYIFVPHTYRLIAYTIAVLLLSNSQTHFDIVHESSILYVIKILGGWFGSVLYIILVIISTRRLSLVLANNLVVRFLCLAMFAMSLVKFYAPQVLPLSPTEATRLYKGLMFVFAAVQRFIILHAIVRTIHLFVSERFPNDVTNFGIAFIAIAILLPVVIVRTVKDKILYIVTRSLAIAVLIVFTIRELLVSSDE